jgi:spermidine/putrescine transport system permease protein
MNVITVYYTCFSLSRKKCVFFEKFFARIAPGALDKSDGFGHYGGDMNEQPERVAIRKHLVLFKKRPNSESARHARMAFHQGASAINFSSLILGGTYVFLFLPLLVTVFYSFNVNKGMAFTGFSVGWYGKLFLDSAPLWDALGNSLLVALVAGGVATVLGTLAAIGLSWYKFGGKSYIKAVSFLPMVLPEVIVGISMLIFFARFHVPLGLFTVIAAHITFCLPFVMLMVRARLDEFDFSIVEASRDLGATEQEALFRVIIPAILPGVLSGFMMAITMSLEDFIITFFVGGPDSRTLPVYVFSMIRYGVSPTVNALSFVMILATFIIAISMRKFLKAFAAAK